MNLIDKILEPTGDKDHEVFQAERQRIIDKNAARTPEEKAAYNRKYSLTYYGNNREKCLAKSKEWVRQNYRHTKVQAARHRAIKKKIAFNLTVEEMVWPTHCPVLGFELMYEPGDRWLAASIDRIDNTLGYTLDNVQVISFKANAMKGNATEEELKFFADWIQKNL